MLLTTLFQPTGPIALPFLVEEVLSSTNPAARAQLVALVSPLSLVLLSVGLVALAGVYLRGQLNRTDPKAGL